MTPETFPDANQTMTAPTSMPDCSDLPVQNDGTQLLSCWRMSWRERIAALVFGRVWLCVAGQSHPPVWLRCERDVHETATSKEGR